MLPTSGIVKIIFHFTSSDQKPIIGFVSIVNNFVYILLESWLININKLVITSQCFSLVLVKQDYLHI